MAEEKKAEKSKDKNKILLVIGALAIAALVLVFISFTDSQNDPLVKDNSNSTVDTEAPQASEAPLTSQEWTWVNTLMNDGSQFLPSTEGAFTLTFQDDGRVIAATDCNGGNGSYELGADSSLTFGPMATTMMFCEESAETQFFQDLNNIGSYMIDENGNLVLMLKFDSGSMIFE